MATDENKVIFSVEVDNQEAIKALDVQTDKITELTVANERLRKEQKEVDDSTTEGLERRKKIGKQIELNKDQIKEERSERNRLVKVIKTNSNSYDALSQRTTELRKRQKNLNTSTKEGAAEYKRLEKQIEKNNKSLKKADANVNVFSRNVGNYTEGLGQLSPALGNAAGGVKQLTKASLAFIATPLGLVIAAIVAGLKLLQTFFKSSEEGQNALNKASKVFGVVLGNIQDIAADLGGKLFELFNNPKENLKKLGQSIKTNIVNRFVGMLELIPALGKAVGKLFKGDFAEAAEIAADAVGKVVLGVEDVTDKIREQGKAFVEETQREIDIARELADRENALIKARREQTVEVAKNAKQIQDLLLAYRDESQSAEERRELIRQANDIKREELELNARLAKENYELIKSQNALSKSTIEDLQAEAEALAAFYQIQAQNAAQLRELKNRENELDRKIFAEREKERKEEKRFLDESIDDLEEYFDKEIELSDASVDAYVANEEAKTEATKAENEKRAATTAQAYIALTAATNQFLQSEEVSLKEFGKLLATALLDQLQAVIIAKQAEILVKSLATADSIATFGASGGARAAVIIGLAQAAFGAAKAGLSKLADGGEVKSGIFGGNYHSSGGTTLSADGIPIAEVERDERFFVVNRKDSAMIDQLSAINSIHGKAFSTPMRYLADGGEVASQSITGQQVVDIIRNTPIYVRVVDITDGVGVRVQTINNGTV